MRENITIRAQNHNVCRGQHEESLDEAVTYE